MNAPALNIVRANVPIRGHVVLGVAALWLCAAVVPAYAITDAAREAALLAVQQVYDSLPGQDLNADAQAMRDFLASRVEFVAVGINDVPKSVWAVFDDGQPIVVELRSLPPPSSAPTAAPSPSYRNLPLGPSAEDLPHAATARILTAMGGLWGDPTSDITSMLNDAGYSFAIGADAGVDSLKRVGGDGVFYIDTHGGRDGYTGMYNIWTSTARDLSFEADGGKYKDDLNPADGSPFRLVRVLAKGDLLLFSVWRYGITEAFVAKYWANFAPGAFVFIDACGSDSPAAQRFKAAVQAKGAPVYLGWTDEMADNDAVPTAKFVFDRLLGANRFDLEDGYKQRPFDYPSVVQDMPYHGRGTSLSAVLRFTPVTPGPNDFSQLAPSIARVSVDEWLGRLTLTGKFGNDPGESDRSVEVGGTALGGCSWDSTGNAIVCDIPLSASGDVVVKSRNHKSNVARLTDWRGTFTVAVSGPGSLAETFTITTHLRADIRKYRPTIHLPPVEPFKPDFKMALDSLTSYATSGSYTDTSTDPPTTYVIEGSGSLQPQDGTLTDRFSTFGGILRDSRTMLMGSEDLATTGALCTISPPGVQTPVPVLLGASFPLTLDDMATIQGNTLPPTPGAIACGGGPLTQTQQTVTWNDIAAAPSTIPDPQSAR